MRTMHINLFQYTEMLFAVFYHFHFEVVDTFSHDINIVILNFVDKIRFHIIFVFSCLLFFLFDAAKVLLFFDMCKFLVQKNEFLYYFSNIGNTKGKIKHANTHKKNHAAQSLRDVVRIQFVSMKNRAKILHINDICKCYPNFCKTNSQKPSCHVASDHTHSAQSYI